MPRRHLNSSLWVQLLVLIGPLLVFLLFGAAYTEKSALLAASNIVLGSFLHFHESSIRQESQEEIERARAEMLGRNPRMGRKVAAYFLMMQSHRFKGYAYSKMASIVGVFAGTVQLLEYW